MNHRNNELVFVFNVPEGYVLIPKAEYEEMKALLKSLSSRVKELEDQLGMNSRNSSKPPSTDSFKKIPKKKQKKGRKSGGQKGHEGHTLQMTETPDEVIANNPEQCGSCGQKLGKAIEGYERRQVFDLPAIKLRITEWRSGCKTCAHCGEKTTGGFPLGITQRVQYGKGVSALVTYLNAYQLIPYKRTAEMMEDLWGARISEGTIHQMILNSSKSLECFETHTKELLKRQEVEHFDETGININGKLHWLHTASTPYLTLLFPHQRRGKEATDEIGILPDFRGTAVHDRWPTYMRYEDCEHGFCNAHIVRELTFFHEEQKQRWAGNLKEVLFDAKRLSEKTCPPSANAIGKVLHRYKGIVNRAHSRCKQSEPLNQPPVGKRGRKKQSKKKNLLDALKKHPNEVLKFLTHPNVPFDNNQAERDVRMSKVKMKISGCFRSVEGARSFARIRSYISTVKKHSLNVLEKITDALQGSPFLPNVA